MSIYLPFLVRPAAGSTDGTQSTPPPSSSSSSSNAPSSSTGAQQGGAMGLTNGSGGAVACENEGMLSEAAGLVQQGEWAWRQDQDADSRLALLHHLPPALLSKVCALHSCFESAVSTLPLSGAAGLPAIACHMKGSRPTSCRSTCCTPCSVLNLACPSGECAVLLGV